VKGDDNGESTKKKTVRRKKEHRE